MLLALLLFQVLCMVSVFIIQTHRPCYFAGNVYGFFSLTGISLCIVMLIGNFSVASLSFTVLSNYFGTVFSFDAINAFFLLILFIVLGLLSFFQKEILQPNYSKFLTINALLIVLSSNLYVLLLLLTVFALILSFYTQIRFFCPVIIASLAFVILVVSNYDKAIIGFTALDYAKVRQHHDTNCLAVLYTMIIFPLIGLFPFNKWKNISAQNEKTICLVPLIVLLTSVLGMYIFVRIWLDLYLWSCSWVITNTLQIIIFLTSIWTGWQCLVVKKPSKVLKYLSSMYNGLLIQIILLLNLMNKSYVDQIIIVVSKQLSAIYFVTCVAFTFLWCVDSINNKSTRVLTSSANYYRFISFFGFFLVLCCCSFLVGYMVFHTNSKLISSPFHSMKFFNVLFFILTMSLAAVIIGLSFVGWARFLLMEQYAIKNLERKGALINKTHEKFIVFIILALIFSCFLFQVFPPLIKSAFVFKMKTLYSLQSLINFGSFFIAFVFFTSVYFVQNRVLTGKFKKVISVFSNKKNIYSSIDRSLMDHLTFEGWGIILQKRLKLVFLPTAKLRKFCYFKVEFHRAIQEFFEQVLEVTHQYNCQILLLVTGAGLIFIGWVCR